VLHVESHERSLKNPEFFSTRPTDPTAGSDIIFTVDRVLTTNAVIL
jgi:hypothetical protein